MDLEGSYTKGSQSGRGRPWYVRYIPGKTNTNIQDNIFTIQKETLRIQSQSVQEKKTVSKGP